MPVNPAPSYTETTRSLHLLAVVRPELSGLVHVLADHFDVEDGLIVALNVVET